MKEFVTNDKLWIMNTIIIFKDWSFFSRLLESSILSVIIIINCIIYCMTNKKNNKKKTKSLPCRVHFVLVFIYELSHLWWYLLLWERSCANSVIKAYYFMKVGLVDFSLLILDIFWNSRLFFSLCFTLFFVCLQQTSSY